ncbi:putative Histidine kinase [Desulfosarcina cetonica]|nr:putative Histidine kinase [Desulfosarcina cetonica]
MASVAASVDRIKALFPAAAPLAAIDVGGWDGPAGSPSPQASSAPDPIVPDIDEVLSSLPDIDAHQRKQLLSETLDETFAFMQADPETARDTDGLDILSGSDDTEADWPPPEMDGPNAAPLSIMDEFGADPSAFLQASDRASEELSAAPSTDADSETELWPSAPETDFPAPSEPAADSGAAPLTLDFSEPRPEVPAGQATDDVPLDSAPFAARSTIRKSIRVDADKIDDLMNQVGELVVNRSTFIQLFQEMRDLVRDFAMRFPKEKAEQRLLAGMTNRFNEATTLLGRVTGELQEQVMKVRMLPISRLFNRYPRLVHDLLKDADKKVQLQFRGEETELDRMVIEQLVDPMIHIIRNAVDHGIESREARKRKGKPEKGILMLDAYHEGSNVVIEITDDGGGIDLSRIRQKAVEKQLVDRAALERMDQRALIDLIMLPGFSTADSVTHTSGRGVGMDVVKSSLEKINGVLTIDTRQDIGTRFRIKIPLTLAIIPALMIRCGGSHFTLPLDAVQETLRIDKGEIFSVDGRQVMHLDEEPLPLIRLSELLNISAPLPPEHEARFFVVVVKATSGMTGLIVDALLGRQEVVVKPLEDYLQESSGFSGATILGDGSISLILNIDELALMAKEREAERRLAATIL